MKEIAQALVKAQKAFGPALKTSSNPHFRSKYADLSACVEAVIDGLNNNGIFLSQPSSECEDGVIVETVFIHESGESWSAGKLHVPASKQDPQGYGSALTYARRYSLMAACGIAPEDDDGNAATKAKPPQKPTPVASVPKHDFDALPMGKQVTLREASELPLEQCEAGDYASAFATIEALGLDSDDKVAFWSLFPSHHRSALRRVYEQHNKKLASLPHQG